MPVLTKNYPTLALALDGEYLTADLKKLASLICTKVPARKQERIDAIVETLFHDLPVWFAQLSDLGQNAVSEALYTWGGVFEGRMFVNKYLASPWQESEKNSSRQIDLLRLFFIRSRIPGDLRQRLLEFVPRPPEDTVRYTDVPDQDLTVRETARAALANLTTFLNLAADKKIRISPKTGRGTAATLKKMGELLYEPDWYDDDEIGPMQPFAWPLLLQGGLTKAEGSFLTLTPAGRKALQKDPAGGIKTAWRKSGQCWNLRQGKN
ncbi:MAG: hypothetical protein R6V20_00480 [Desulfobia sp.]